MNITIIAFLYINLGGVVQGERPTEKCDFGDKVLKQIWDSSIFHRKWFLIWIKMGVPSLNTSSCSPPTLVSLAGTEKDIIFLQFHETSSRSLSCGCCSGSHTQPRLPRTTDEIPLWTSSHLPGKTVFRNCSLPKDLGSVRSLMKEYRCSLIYPACQRKPF